MEVVTEMGGVLVDPVQLGRLDDLTEPLNGVRARQRPTFGHLSDLLDPVAYHAPAPRLARN